MRSLHGLSLREHVGDIGLGYPVGALRRSWMVSPPLTLVFHLGAAV